MGISGSEYKFVAFEIIKFNKVHRDAPDRALDPYAMAPTKKIETVAVEEVYLS
jgi:hypothetical protein